MYSKSNNMPACICRFALVAALILCFWSPSLAYNITVGWDSNDEPDLEGYAVYYNIGSPGPPYKYIKDFPENKLTDPLNPMVTITGLKENTNYYVAVTAYNTDGNESVYSDDICVQIVDAAAALCGSVSSVKSSSSSGGGSGSGGFCFISIAGSKSECPRDEHLLLSWRVEIYFALLLLIILSAAWSIFLKTSRD